MTPDEGLAPSRGARRLKTGLPEGFVWTARKDGRVEIHHHGRLAATLRGAQAAAFQDEISKLDEAAGQQRMARLTGNYKRGNERR